VDTSRSLFSTISTWHWQFTAGDTSNVASPFYHYTAVGAYPVTLTATDRWGCTATVSETIIVYPPPTVTASPDTVVCVGDSATLQGHGALTYTWTPTTTLTCPTCQTTYATPPTVTTYTVTGTDAHGCINIDSVTVGLRTTTDSRAWGDTEVCQMVPVHLFDTGGTRYTWIPSAGLSNASIGDPIATPVATTHYMVIAQLGSCIPDTNYVLVTIHPLPTVDAGPDQRLLAGQLAYINSTGSLISAYSWSPANTLSCETCANPVASMISTTTYTVTVSSDFGCRASDAVTIFVFCDESQLFIPNSFTPNGDGQNDVFYPRGSGVSKIKTFRIYNRWGDLIFERLNIDINDVNNAWDGSFKGASPKPDVYVYLIDATCGTGEPLFIKGDITILK
jgi:gliding motility-associated-like protein